MSERARLKRLFLEQQPYLAAWGAAVRDEVLTDFRDVRPQAGEDFFVIPPSCRVKNADSFVLKCSKPRDEGPYLNPLEDITDRVGVRFVMLLQADVEFVREKVKSCGRWEARQDRDYLKERDNEPTKFLYQSHHFIVFSKEGEEVDGIKVPTGTPCEVQIRTLLQHAYSELTHDTIYKGKLAKNKEVLRRVARSMALIEATDEIFSDVVTKMEELRLPMRTLQAKLEHLYSRTGAIGASPSRELDDYILDHLLPEIEARIPALPSALQEYIDSNPDHVGGIAARAALDPLFAQPSVLLLMYLLDRYSGLAEEYWPLTPDDLHNVKLAIGVGSA